MTSRLVTTIVTSFRTVFPSLIKVHVTKTCIFYVLNSQQVEVLLKVHSIPVVNLLHTVVISIKLIDSSITTFMTSSAQLFWKSSYFIFLCRMIATSKIFVWSQSVLIILQKLNPVQQHFLSLPWMGGQFISRLLQTVT